MSRSRRIALVLAAGAVALLLTVTLALAWLNGESGRTWLVEKAGDVLAPSGLTLTVEGLGGRLPQHLAADGITLGDADGAWLTIAGLELRWRPWSLLAGRIEVTALRSEGIELLRAPVTTAAEAAPAAESGWPWRLLRSRVAALDIGRVELGEGLLPGGPAAWRIEGEVGAPAPAGRLHRLAIRRIDGRDDHLTMRAVQDPAGEELALRLALGEAPGGLLSAAAGAGPDAGLRLLLEGEGPLAEWRGRLDGELGDARVDAELTVDGPAAGLRFEGRLVPGTLLSAAAGGAGEGGLDAPFDLAAHIQHDAADERLSVTGLRLDHPAAEIAGDLAVGLTDGDVEARLTLTQRSPEGLAALLRLDAAQQLKLAVAAVGTLPRPELTVIGEAGSLAVAGFEASGLKLRSMASPVGDGWRFDAALASSQLLSEDPRIAPLLGGAASLALAGQWAREEGLTLERIDLQGPAASLAGRAELDPASGRVAAPLSLAVSDLRALAGWTGLEFAGGADLNLDFDRGAGGDPWRLTFDGKTRDLAVDVPVLRALVSPVTRLTGALVLDRDDGLTLRDVRLAGARAMAEATLRMPAGFERLVGDVTVEVPDASVLDEDLGLALTGPARAVGRLDGPLADPGLTGTVTVVGLSLIHI